MTRRISIGATVQTTSMAVLWVVFDGVRVGLGVELDHDDQQQKQNEQGDDRDQPQHPVVELGDVVHDRGHGILQSELPGLGDALSRKSLTTGPSQNGAANDSA